MCWPKFSSTSTPSKLMWSTPCRSPCATTSESAALEALSSGRTRRSLPWLHRQQTPLLLRSASASSDYWGWGACGVLPGGGFGGRHQPLQGDEPGLAGRLDHSRRQGLHRLPLRGSAGGDRLTFEGPAQEEIQAANGCMGGVFEQAHPPVHRNGLRQGECIVFQEDPCGHAQGLRA